MLAMLATWVQVLLLVQVMGAGRLYRTPSKSLKRVRKNDAPL